MKKDQVEQITITPPNFKRIKFDIVGTSPYMQLKFSQKAKAAMMEKMEAGSQAKKGKKRDPRDFDDDFLQAQHISTEGWNGIPCSAFRNASIDACRMVGYHMTHARMSVFIEHDGLDKVEGTPLVQLIAEDPERSEMATRNATGVADIRIRPMWREWRVQLKVKYDGDQFTANDVLNLIARAGQQVGVGEGRPFSKKSNGMGFGTFKVEAYALEDVKN